MHKFLSSFVLPLCSPACAFHSPAVHAVQVCLCYTPVSRCAVCPCMLVLYTSVTRWLPAMATLLHRAARTCDLNCSRMQCKLQAVIAKHDCCSTVLRSQYAARVPCCATCVLCLSILIKAEPCWHGSLLTLLTRCCMNELHFAHWRWNNCWPLMLSTCNACLLLLTNPS